MICVVGMRRICDSWVLIYLCHLARIRCPVVVFAGAPLWKILAAGEWRSPTFLAYVDQHRMEMDMVLQGYLDEESDDDPEPLEAVRRCS